MEFLAAILFFSFPRNSHVTRRENHVRFSLVRGVFLKTSIFLNIFSIGTDEILIDMFPVRVPLGAVHKPRGLF